MACSYGYEGGPKIPRKVTESMQRSARWLKESGSNGLRGKNQKGQLLAMTRTARRVPMATAATITRASSR